MEFKGTKRNWSEAEFPDLISFSHPGMALSGRATEETVANGRLAMAAPDLLKELKRLRDYVINVCGVDDGDCDIEHPLMSSQVAISKALGEE